MDERINELENEKRLLIADLTAPSSDVGDWKVIKNIEFTLAGLEPPYDPVEVHEKRKMVRDRINEIEVEIEALIKAGGGERLPNF